MRYFKIPIYDGQPDISPLDNFDLLFFTGDNKIVYGIFVEGTIRDSWEEITEEQFENLTMATQKIEIEETVMEKLIKIENILNLMKNDLDYLLNLQTSQYAMSENLLEPNE